MKYIFVVLVALVSGCASVSEYNQGCRDGVQEIIGSRISQTDTNKYCDNLDSAHKAAKKIEAPRK